MRRSPPQRHASRGFTLVELLIAMTMLLAITGAAYSMFRSQTTSFRKNTERYDLTQNVRNALESAGRVVRTMGAGVAPGQPMLVYGGNAVLAFNSDHVERDTVDMRWAAYWNPDAPLEETVAWPVAGATVLPNSAPTYTYPDSTYRMGNGALSPAETYILWFESDTDTPRADDFVLRQRVNAGTPEILARGILPHPNGRPFFEYLLHRVLPAGDTLLVANAALLPLIRRPLIAGISTADSAARVRPDSVRAVRMHLRITNGLTSTDERFRDVSTTIDTPNNGIALPTVCGRPPLQPASFGVTDTIPGSGIVWLSWTPSVDEAAGEQDVRQYVVWRRLAAQPAWAEPLLIVKATPGTVAYTSEVSGNLPGTNYVFGVASQDCTPNFSTIRTVAITTSVTP
jgi:prepilin-type N-terminal cleavage/methylation domain-containing protein